MENPVDTLIAFLVAALVIAAVVIQRLITSKRRGQESANKSMKSLLVSQTELQEARKYNQQLEAENKRHLDQVAYCFKSGNCFDRGWAIVGIKKVRKESVYKRDESNENRKHLGEKKNVFNPIPVPPTKLPETNIEYEPVLILVDNIWDDKFTVMVVRPDDIGKLPLKVLAKADIKPMCIPENGWDFDFPQSVKGTGALSLTMDYILARAKAQRVSVLNAKLNHITDEAHRSRLYYFYIARYEFVYRYSPTNHNGYITKYFVANDKIVWD